MRRLIQDFPEARTCPADTLRALRAIEPTTEVIYLGPSPKGGRWLLARVEPSSERRAGAAKAIAGLLRIPHRRRDLGWSRRLWLARAKYQGLVPRYIYECVEPGSAIVENVRHAYYDNLNTRDGEAFAAYDAAEAAERAANEADLTNKHRAHEAHSYAFTRSHAVTRSYQAAGDVDTRSSVRTTHPIPAA